MKRCAKCHELKDHDSFYRNRSMKDGFCSSCKSCESVRAKAWKQANSEKCRVIAKRWRARHPEKNRLVSRMSYLRHKESVAETARRWRQRNPDKHRSIVLRQYYRWRPKELARQAVRRAVRRGLLVKPDACQSCGNKHQPARLHGHHHSYNEPLNVTWLCATCHTKADGRAGKTLQEAGNALQYCE